MSGGTAADSVNAARRRDSEDLLRMAGRMARFGGWSVDAASGAISLTDDTLRMFGIDPTLPLTNDVAWSLHADGDRDRVGALLEKCLREGEPFDIESTMVTRDGTRLKTRTIGEAERDASGTIIRAHGAVWDITEYTQERDRARDLEERLTASLRAISDGLMYLDTDYRITFANPSVAALLDRSESELVGRVLWEAYPKTVGTPFERAFRSAVTNRTRVIHREWVEATKRWVDITIYPVETGLVVHHRDTTDDVRAREREREAARQLQQQAALLDIARDAIIVRDFDERIQYWNRSAAELYGYPAAEAIGRRSSELLYDDPSHMRAATAEVMREGYWAGELQQRTRSGDTLIADCRWQLLYDDDGAPRAVLCVNSDITAYKKEQEARARAQRMESLGTLAGGIAHDLNNVLTPVLMSVQLLALDEDEQPRRELLDAIESSVKRGAAMIAQVLTFARGVDGQRETIDLDTLLDDLAAYARRVMPEQVAIEVSRPERLPTSTGDPTQIMQVLVNLVVNARDAMGATGTLRISVTEETLDEPQASISHTAHPGDYVIVSIEDDGHGMPPEVLSKIFEPFFTTKEPGSGTGLGLSTTLAIMRSHGGFVQVYSELGHGTHFRVGLPRTARSTAAATAAVTSPTAPGGSGELIVVVDDEAAIRRVAAKTLEAHGYRCITASNGREAIALIESSTEPIDLVLTDLMMPEMDGAATTAYLEEHHPHIPIIAASGLASHGEAGRTIGMGVARFLPKPFTTSLLLETVHETLVEHAHAHEEETTR